MRRYTRLSNGFSRKVENHMTAVALNFFAYNFIKIHRSLRMSPAMAAGVATRADAEIEGTLRCLAEKREPPFKTSPFQPRSHPLLAKPSRRLENDTALPCRDQVNLGPKFDTCTLTQS
jgi:hypothetical protein